MLAAQTAQLVLRLPPAQGPRTLQWIFLFHIAFYAVFLPRWLQRQRQKAVTPTANAGGEAGGPSAAGASPPGATPPAAGATPPAAGTTPPAAGTTPPAAGTTPPAAGTTPDAAGGEAVPPFPRAPLVLHALAMGVLYYGLDTAVLGLRGSGPWLFSPPPWAPGSGRLPLWSPAAWRWWRSAATCARAARRLCCSTPSATPTGATAPRRGGSCRGSTRSRARPASAGGGGRL